jgi:hypothetical protein
MKSLVGRQLQHLKSTPCSHFSKSLSICLRKSLFAGFTASCNPSDSSGAIGDSACEVAFPSTGLPPWGWRIPGIVGRQRTGIVHVMRDGSSANVGDLMVIIRWSPASPGGAATSWWPASESAAEYGYLSDVVAVVRDGLPEHGKYRRRLLGMGGMCEAHLTT